MTLSSGSHGDLVPGLSMWLSYYVDVVFGTVLCIVSLVPCDISLYTFFMQKLCGLGNTHTWCWFHATSYNFLSLTLKAPITTAADDIHKYFFIVFQRK